MLTGRVYRGLASLNLAAGLAMVLLFALTRMPLLLVLSSVGLVMGTAMWRLVVQGPRDQRWWLRQHMNAATVHFAATHDSFLALAVGSIIPTLRTPWPRALIAAAVLTLALAVRIGLGRRYLRYRSAREQEGGAMRSLGVRAFDFAAASVPLLANETLAQQHHVIANDKIPAHSHPKDKHQETTILLHGTGPVEFKYVSPADDLRNPKPGRRGTGNLVAGSE